MAVKKVKTAEDNAPKWLRSGKFALFALGASVIVMLLARKMLKTDLPILLIWLVISVVITMRYEPAVFHNFICPFGALLKASGKYAVLSKRIIKEKCIGCRLCEKVCPADAVAVNTADKKAVINRVLCLQCSNCQRICPEDAICYGKQKNVPKAAES
jgi:ferredoxin-type protein NapH